jgi:release factor glutamine methyltransferase
MKTLASHVRDAALALERAGIAQAEARLDAVLLARHLLGWDLATWIVRDGDAAGDTFLERFGGVVARRAAREPMAYILGRAEFWDLEFIVTPAVLIPRPETEILVEEALARVPAAGARVVADVGTGTGCLAIALAHERGDVRVMATDVSEAALAVAARNAETCGVADRVDLVRCSLLEGVTRDLDLVVSNPPYVDEHDRPSLPPEVRDFEPPVALYSHEGGLGVIRELVAQSAAKLLAGGWLLFEFGFGQHERVRRLLDGPDWIDVAIRDDLQGIPRTAIARRRA